MVDMWAKSKTYFQQVNERSYEMHDIDTEYVALSSSDMIQRPTMLFPGGQTGIVRTVRYQM